MTSLKRLVAIGITVIATAMVLGCTFPTRTGYDRRIGGYKPIPRTETIDDNTNFTEEASANNSTAQAADSATVKLPSQTSAGAVKAAAANKSKPQPPKARGSLEQYARGWLGAKYVYGKATRKQTDCSGFVMQVYKGYYGIAFKHNAHDMFKDSRGSSVSRGRLREGDLVFFGSFWKIDHVGIYLSGDRFIHASTSKGVVISPMSDKYWGNKYQGARRFK
ncbi:MAG: NlpC/P60 family protein [Fibrobacter sp.]|nr:NlpC/P60 family protein [Fibrobacter sp.]